MGKTIRLGSQTPTFSVVGEYHHTFKEQCARLFERWGVRFYPCQKDELGLFLARNARNRFACRTICITKPRQNGKSFGVRFYAIWMAAVEGRNVLFTAHRGKTVRKMFKFIRAFVLHTPDLAAKLLPGADGIYKAAGSEGVYFANGGMIEFATRTDGGARGETYDVIVFDEAQELTQDQYDACVPTTIASESGDPQKIYLGTPPGPKCLGTVFRGLYDKAHGGDPTGVWWIEWAASEVPDMSDHLGVLELVYQTNPAMGYRIKEDVMLDVIRTSTSPDGFAREFLGWWSPTSNIVTPISAIDWGACRIDRKSVGSDGAKTFAVKFSAEGHLGVIAVCVMQADGRPHVEVVEAAPVSGGVGWLVDRVVRAASRSGTVVIDGRGRAQTLVDEARAAGVDARKLYVPSAAEVVAAYDGFVNATQEHTLTHAGQPQLDEAACGCGKRKIGNAGGFGFASVGNAEAALVEACALAHWRAMQERRRPKRTMRIG